MGKAARRAKSKTVRFLSSLAKENPERFIDEWDGRLNGWLKDIHSYKHGFIESERVFSIMEKALNILLECGEAAVALQYSNTYEVLSNECCRVVSFHCGDVRLEYLKKNVMYKLTPNYGFRL
jgi:hypothetical protein